MLPQINSVLVENVGDEILIHPNGAQEAHCLKGAALKIFQACRDRWDMESTVELLKSENSWDRTTALSTLQKVILDLERLGICKKLDDMTRRNFLDNSRKLTITAPFILSVALAAPTAAMSGCIPAAQCNGTNFGTPCLVFGESSCTNGVCVQSYLKGSMATDCMGDTPFFFNCISTNDPDYDASCNIARGLTTNTTYYCHGC